MTDTEILDNIYSWAADYLDALTACDQESRTYADALREALDLMTDRVWVDGDDEPIEPDEEPVS